MCTTHEEHTTGSRAAINGNGAMVLDLVALPHRGEVDNIAHVVRHHPVVGEVLVDNLSHCRCLLMQDNRVEVQDDEDH